MNSLLSLFKVRKKSGASASLIQRMIQAIKEELKDFNQIMESYGRGLLKDHNSIIIHMG